MDWLDPVTLKIQPVAKLSHLIKVPPKSKMNLRYNLPKDLRFLLVELIAIEPTTS